MTVSGWMGSLLAWERELARLKQRISPVFGRRELKGTAGMFLDGLLSQVERKTGWLLAEQAGLEGPYRMQSLLGRSRWDADALRDEVCAYVVEALGDADAGQPVRRGNQGESVASIWMRTPSGWNAGRA